MLSLTASLVKVRVIWGREECNYTNRGVHWVRTRVKVRVTGQVYGARGLGLRSMPSSNGSSPSNGRTAPGEFNGI